MRCRRHAKGVAAVRHLLRLPVDSGVANSEALLLHFRHEWRSQRRRSAISSDRDMSGRFLSRAETQADEERPTGGGVEQNTDVIEAVGRGPNASRHVPFRP